MTTNEMILATIKTKLTREPKYKSVLEDMGYRVTDSSLSTYNNWTVVNPKTNKFVCFSKSSLNRRMLFGRGKGFYTYDFKKFDYVGYLKSTREPVTAINHSKYKVAIAELTLAKNKYNAYAKYVNDIEFKIENLEREAKAYREFCEQYKQEIETIRENVRKWKEK